MKKHVFPLLTLPLFFVMVAYVSTAIAQPELNAYFGVPIEDSQIDGIIGEEWSDAGNFSGITINPQGSSNIIVKNDGENLYAALQFTVDSDNPWVAIMFASAGHMTTNVDGAVFGDDRLSANGYSDVRFGGPGIVSPDPDQNGKGAILVDSQNIVTIELKKPLNSGDSTGRDIAWATGNTYSLTIMWDTNGAGSNGGSVSHYNGALTSKTLFISTSVIPELPALLVLAILAALLFSAVILKRNLNSQL